MKAGVNVFCPVAHTHHIAEHGDIDPTINDFWMNQDKAILVKCDGLIVCKLPGLPKSAGVAEEIEFAAAHGMPIVHMDPNQVDQDLLAQLKPPRHESILDEAKTIVHDPRRVSYGDPAVNHTRTAAMWNAYLGSRLTQAMEARDVCMLNILQKVSREANQPKRDNLTDIAGFAANAEMCGEKQ
jgi:hypothetical protein